MRVKHIETKNQLQFLGWLLRPLLFTGQTVNIQTFPVPRFGKEIRVLPTFGSQQRHDVSEMSCSKDVGLPNDQRDAEHWDAMRVVIEGALWESI